MGNKKIPKIRFNNSKIDWQQVKFKNLLNSEEGIRRGPFGSALKKELFVQNSEYVVYEQQNAIYDHFNIRYRISEEKYHELKKFILLHGDFIMSGAGTIGKISLVPEGIEKGVFNQALIRLRVNRNTDKEFFLQWMRSPEMQNKLTKANPASAMVNLVPMSEVKEWEVIVPSLDEQSAIGSLFRTLDDLLASYKVNLANYQSLKATMLSKMFPKAGHTVPEIRLDGFEGEWENIRLGDCAIIKGRLGWKSLKQEEYTEIGPSMIAGKHIKNGVIDWGEVDHIPQWRYDESPDIMLENGDIIFSKDGSLGNPALVSNLKGEATINSTMMLVRLDKKVSSQFFYQVLTSSVFQKLIYLKVSGSSIPHLFQADMQDFKFFAPCIEEQQAIGVYFSNLDNLINSHQEKISQLETLKKKLLQDMFI